MGVILLVGGADTGRAPMAAALLQRLLDQAGHDCSVSSAGVLGHDGAPAEPEARDTMIHLGLDIGSHTARTLDADLATQATLLLAVDSGVARVLRMRFPTAEARIYTLGELADRQRDIPDPFRMQIGAWLTYAAELESLLKAALPQLIALLPEPHAPPDQPAVGAARIAVADRLERLLNLAIELPGVIDWAAAQTQVAEGLTEASAPSDPADLAPAYVGMLRAALAIMSAGATSGQIAALSAAIKRLRSPISQTDLNELAAQLAGWAALSSNEQKG